MSLSTVLGVRVVLLLVIGYLYLDSGDSFFLALGAIVLIGAAWTVYRAMRDGVR